MRQIRLFQYPERIRIMFHYFLYGSHIISDREFFQLLPYDGRYQCTQPEIHIREEKELKICNTSGFIRFGVQETVAASDSCIIKICSCDTLLYRCREDDAAREWLPHFILGIGMALLLYQRNQIAMHASCVYDDRGAVLLCGESGAGKSTTASFLLDKGYRFMADDITLVDADRNGNIYAYAAFPFRKLCPEVVKKRNISLADAVCLTGEDNKYMIPYRGSMPETSVPVRAIIILTLSESMQICAEELKGVQKAYSCRDNMFLSTILEGDLHTVQQGHAIMQIASAIPVFRIARPCKIDSQKDVEKIILSILSL